MRTPIKKALFIKKVLDFYFPDPPIPLKHSDPYTLLIAVMLSAQCTDERVNTVTPSLFALAKTPQKMSGLAVSQILEIIRPCGLGPAKAKNIHATSTILVEKYGGKVPASLEELEELPGVGHKTASVLLIQAFGQLAFPVDTHIHRLLTRWGITNGKSVQQTERDAKKFFPPETWPKLHLQLIYFGRKYCPARGHDPQSCPVCSQL